MSGTPTSKAADYMDDELGRQVLSPHISFDLIAAAVAAPFPASDGTPSYYFTMPVQGRISRMKLLTETAIGTANVWVAIAPLSAISYAGAQNNTVNPWSPIPGVTVTVGPNASTSATVVMGSTAGIIPGMPVTDNTNPTYIPAGTYVKSVTNGTTLVMSAASTTAITTDSLTFGGQPFATAATSATSAAGSSVLTFTAVPAWVTVGMSVFDTTAPGIIPLGTVVVSKTSTTVTVSNPFATGGVGSADVILFNAMMAVGIPYAAAGNVKGAIAIESFGTTSYGIQAEQSPMSFNIPQDTLMGVWVGSAGSSTGALRVELDILSTYM
jgi:hypothetical protein